MKPSHRRFLTPVLIAATLSLGISMPSCPGQQAMQGQIDGIDKRESALTLRLQTLENRVKSLNTEMDSLKPQLAQMSGIVIEQKRAIEALQAEIVKLHTAKAAPATKAATSKSKPTSRGKR